MLDFTPNNEDKMTDLRSTVFLNTLMGDLCPFIYYYRIIHKYKRVPHDSAAPCMDAWSMHGHGEHAPKIQHCRILD